ncbi:MAG: Lrp/AsnC family transcriptional regulator [Nanoarchaeota archaeon]|nr:Lrp/AsnC family transcriptional regulator [Nanoarchaeota archaeon]
MKLNLKQKKILKLISINCRFTNKDIAKSVGMSEDAVAYQINKLIIEKKLARFNVQFFFPMLSYESYHIWLRLKEEDIKKLKDIKDIHSINKSNGKYDCQILVFAKSQRDFRNILKQIKKKVSIQQINYAKVINNYKNFSNVITLLDIPVKIPKNKKKFEYVLNDIQYAKVDFDTRLSIDKTDKKIIKSLLEHPRASFQKLAHLTGLNHETIRYRMKIFVKEKLITNFGLIHNFDKYGIYVNYFLINIDEKNIKEFLNYINSINNVFYCAKLSGDYNCIVYVASSNPIELGEINSNIRKSLGNSIKDFDMLFLREILKYEQFPQRLFG